MDDSGNCYIIYKNKSQNKNEDFFKSEFLEIFLLIPLKEYEESKTLVIFLSNIDYLNDRNNFNFDFFELNFSRIFVVEKLLSPVFFALVER